MKINFKDLHKIARIKHLPLIVIVLTLMVIMIPSTSFGVLNLWDAPQGLPDIDTRKGHIKPNDNQLAQLTSLDGVKANWTKFGTVSTLTKDGGYIATNLKGAPVEAARNWIRSNREFFRLSSQSVNNLELINDGRMPYSDAHYILFRQKIGNFSPTKNGLINVSIVDGKVFHVWSTSAGDQEVTGRAVLSPSQAWVSAASNLNFTNSLADVVDAKVDKNDVWTELNVTGLDQKQQVRMTVLPTPEDGARIAYEVNVINVKGHINEAYTLFIDAENGNILHRANRVNYFMPPETESFSGQYQDDPQPLACGPRHQFTVGPGKIRLQVLASAAILSNDIYINIYFNNGVIDTLVATGDLGTSPEEANYAPGGGVPPGLYKVEICPFSPPTAPAIPPYNYVGTFTADDSPLPEVTPNPKWKYFLANPDLDYVNTDLLRKIGCWRTSIDGAPVPGCDQEEINVAARAPWDYDVNGGAATNTTRGNNAQTAESWGSPLTPSTPYSPISASRDYDFPWTNHWNREKCDPTIIQHSGDAVDIDTSVTQLFIAHNRFHDWSYFLGFTEANYNLQVDNFGITGAARENDPEIGNVQAGAISGGAPSYLGRDNANQITLQDGVPGITNQYLFQPIAGAFYAPCSDGTLDVGIVGHEYTHAISNRMVGGPDDNIGGHQGGSMGESWGDLDAAEYLNAFNYLPTNDENITAVGIYATNNRELAIRDYNMEDNPLNYSNIGFDSPGPEVHSDGEVWNAVNWDIRQALIDKYDAQYPYSDVTRRIECAKGERNPSDCAGNRRWIQLVFDSFLLQAGPTSMLDARDAMLAADVARFGGANQTELWQAFASRGFGELANTNGTDDTAPIADYSSPVETNEANVTFTVTAPDEANVAITNAKIYVGKYEARSRPIADTNPVTTVTADPRTNINDDNALFVPGEYEFVVQAPGYGMQRFTRVFSAGQTIVVNFPLPTNRASITNGATVLTTATDPLDIAAAVNLIDDTESTGARLGTVGAVNTHRMTVDLQGVAPVNVTNINVSTLAGPNNGGRFTGVRKFEIWTCNNGTCLLPTDFTLAYTSPDDAFPANVPRPVQPQMQMRSFDIPDTMATHLQLRVATTQCTGQAGFLGEQDNDPLNDTDCLASANGIISRATELQVFSSAPSFGLEADTSPRSSFGNDAVSSTDVTQIRRFAVSLDAYSPSFNEFQRADTAPYSSFGNGVVSATDITQARRYQVTLDPLANAAGPTAPIGSFFEDNKAPSTSDLASNRAVRVVDVKTEAGGSVDVTLEADALGDEAVYGFTLKYNQKALSNPRVSMGDDASNGNVLVNTNQDGRIAFSVDFNGDTIVSGENRRFITIRFDVNAEAGGFDTTLEFSNEMAYKEVSDKEANALPIRFENGMVYISK